MKISSILSEFLIAVRGFRNPRWLARLSAVFLMITGMALMGAGCGTIHEQTVATLPPEPFARLKLRIDEAREAEKAATEACTKLRDIIADGFRGAGIQIDIDRVEVSAFELERRVASAQDAAARCKERARMDGELERLAQRSRELMGDVPTLRRGDPSAISARMNAFLRGTVKR